MHESEADNEHAEKKSANQRGVRRHRPHGGCAIPIISSPGEYRREAQSNQSRNRFDYQNHYRDSPGTSRKTSSGSKLLISLGLWVDFYSERGKTSSGLILLTTRQFQSHMPSRARKTRSGLVHSRGAERLVTARPSGPTTEAR
jgi:hypothetical protein